MLDEKKETQPALRPHEGPTNTRVTVQDLRNVSQTIGDWAKTRMSNARRGDSKSRKAPSRFLQFHWKLAVQQAQRLHHG